MRSKICGNFNCIMSKIMDWNVAIRMELFVDNKSTIDSAKHHVSHGRSKHIEKKLKLETKYISRS